MSIDRFFEELRNAGNRDLPAGEHDAKLLDADNKTGHGKAEVVGGEFDGKSVDVTVDHSQPESHIGEYGVVNKRRDPHENTKKYY